MQKPQFKVQLDADTQKRLHEIGGRYGLSGNAVVAAAAHELARVRPENLFHALGRIAAGEGVEILPPQPDALPEPRTRPKRALPVSG